jgi:transcription elongation factor Elf1
MKPLAEIPPYTIEQWNRDREDEGRGEILRCPNCDHHEWFRLIPRVDHQPAERACKVCGFQQQADGTPAYRCKLTAHVCLGPRPDEGQCPECDSEVPFQSWHLCAKVLVQEQIGQRPCALCGTVLAEDHVIPWAVEADELAQGEAAEEDDVSWWRMLDLGRLRALSMRWWER